MADCIEREAILKKLKESGAICGFGENLIEQFPAADVAPVTYGEWIADVNGYNRCSACGWEWDDPEYVTPYCPHCGAEMDGGSDNAAD